MSRQIFAQTGLAIPSYSLMQADWQLRTNYSTLPLECKNNDFHYGDIVLTLALSVAAEKNTSITPADKKRLSEIFRSHQELENYFCHIPSDALRALLLLQEHEFRTIAISNANGNLEDDLLRFGIRHFFEELLDSGAEGIAKPKPEIFTRAADRCGVKIENILHVGDNPTADIQGALNAGMQAALYDPIGIYPEVQSPAPQFRNHVDLVERLLESRIANTLKNAN
ncbi:HAD-IA family hydrolase [Candidatus Uhrbacteria bacterium]|nr:HAD-IA family hydrolase [Candidatus Uhrbacteria bacterium]